MQVMVKLPVASEQPVNQRLTLLRTRSCRMKLNAGLINAQERPLRGKQREHETSHHPGSVYFNPERCVTL